MRILGGTLKNREILSPKGDKTRPTLGKLRGAIFNIVQQEIEGAKFLDLFAGSGAMGLEALSRGAARSFFVEQDQKTARLISENGQKLQVSDQMKVVCQDALESLDYFSKKSEKFDLIFADPPYGQGFGERLLKKLDRLELLSEAGRLFIEEDKSFKGDQVSLLHLKFVRCRPYGDTFIWEYST